MISEIKKWFERTLIFEENFHPEKIGIKRVIYSNRYQAPLISLFIDPPPVVGPSWTCVTGKTLSESFFIKLKNALQDHECWWLLILFPQNEYVYLHGVGSADDTSWHMRKLYAFENIGSQGGRQILGLLIGEQRDLLIIELNDGIEISFYGSESVWIKIKNELNSAN
ncbi:hypothetical protein JIN85_16120 [Luteolibacter pohnpeiensis]|uniref:Uncharacterized protein n=1 Tax=Luteolibacter pohnpeiensis TaxID=454153 RepID=A0A934S781_9BACT|nr:hypothetical protein [Luteolibacter pohnpeiensis]MBK1883946.1 hypothetical protein [Luteolibacter pohnpeiensis]